jgi:hypothetical protein
MASGNKAFRLSDFSYGRWHCRDRNSGVSATILRWMDEIITKVWLFVGKQGKAVYV